MKSRATGSRKRKYRVFIIDDHPLVRAGLKDLIESQKDLAICGEAENASGALKTIKGCKPDIAVVDLSLGRDSGIRLIEDLTSSFEALPLLVLSMHDELVHAERCLKAGAKGYIMKEKQPAEVLEAIRSVLNGEICLSDRLRKRFLNAFVSDKFESHDTSVEILSNRELEVYQLIGKGIDKREIAEQLHLSVKTIETYMSHIIKKMNFKGSRELLMNAVKWVSKI